MFAFMPYIVKKFPKYMIQTFFSRKSGYLTKIIFLLLCSCWYQDSQNIVFYIKTHNSKQLFYHFAYINIHSLMRILCSIDYFLYYIPFFWMKYFSFAKFLCSVLSAPVTWFYCREDHTLFWPISCSISKQGGTSIGCEESN